MDNTEYFPLVSVGIPTYNRPEGLHRMLKSITRQTYDNLEIIVSDNCSPDSETEKIVSQFMELDKRIQYYRQETNKGIGFNFTFVLEKSTGDFFMWAADDDEYSLDYIESTLQEIGDSGLVATGAKCIRPDGTLVHYYDPAPVPEFKSRYEEIYWYLYYTGPAHVYGLYRASFLKTLLPVFSNPFNGLDHYTVFFIAQKAGIKIKHEYKYIRTVSDDYDRCASYPHMGSDVDLITYRLKIAEQVMQIANLSYQEKVRLINPYLISGVIETNKRLFPSPLHNFLNFPLKVLSFVMRRVLIPK